MPSEEEVRKLVREVAQKDKPSTRKYLRILIILFVIIAAGFLLYSYAPALQHNGAGTYVASEDQAKQVLSNTSSSLRATVSNLNNLVGNLG